MFTYSILAISSSYVDLWHRKYPANDKYKKRLIKMVKFYEVFILKTWVSENIKKNNNFP